MPRSTADDYNEEQVVWKKILGDLQALAGLRDSSDSIAINLSKVPEGRPNKAIPLYREGIEKTHEEKVTIQRALENLSILIALREPSDAAENKRKKRKIEAEGLLISNSKKIRRYSGADSNGIIPVGQQVAARTPKDKNKQEEWILARVLQYSSEKNKYAVEDDEADESGKKMRYYLPARSVIMIADDDDPLPEFPVGHTILALYPSTTCFYKGVVAQPPSKLKDTSHPTYRIKFDDDEGNERVVPARMVLDMPKVK
ncbi:SAGA HAT/Core module component [Actinomortierella wolfii]|nr:SAGA HAT/Core module component [Actinomortierella wolfii]